MSIPLVQRRRVVFICGGWCALMSGLLTSGCVSKRDQIAQAMGTGVRAPSISDAPIEGAYRLHYPDSVDILVAGMPECTGRFPINVEGRIDIPHLENPRIDGETVHSLQRHIANELGLPTEQVQCRVNAHRSRVVFVRGAIDGGDRAVPYLGPESSVDFIRRCGGLLPSANVKDIHIVRGNIAHGTRPQVFAVDLEAILLRGEPDSNVLLQSFDEVLIGELPRAKLGRALPEFLRPVYRGMCGIIPWLCPHDWRKQIREPANRRFD